MVSSDRLPDVMWNSENLSYRQSGWIHIQRRVHAEIPCIPSSTFKIACSPFHYYNKYNQIPIPLYTMSWFQIFQDGPEYDAPKRRRTFTPPHLSLKELRHWCLSLSVSFFATIEYRCLSSIRFLCLCFFPFFYLFLAFYIVFFYCIFLFDWNLPIFFFAFLFILCVFLLYKVNARSILCILL